MNPENCKSSSDSDELNSEEEKEIEMISFNVHWMSASEVKMPNCENASLSILEFLLASHSFVQKIYSRKRKRNEKFKNRRHIIYSQCRWNHVRTSGIPKFIESK